MRFDEAFLVQLRYLVDLPSLIARDAPLRRTGALWKGACPFHDDKTPSFVVGDDTGYYRCFGCNARGDAIQWMRAFHGMSFFEAVRELAADHSLPLPQSRDEPETEEQRSTRRRHASLFAALEEAQRIYRYGLSRSNSALAYLEQQRGITPDTCSRFELGAVGSGIIHLLRSQPPEILLGAGLACQDDGGALRDRFRNRIMIPIRTLTGRLTGFAGRTLGAAPGTPKYVNSPATELFQKGEVLYGLGLARPAIRRGSVAVLTEGYFDVISLHQHGEHRAVGQMGTSLTTSQARLLLRHADSVILAYDGDKPGQAAALESALSLLGEMKDGKTVSVAVLPADEDPDSLIRAVGIAGWHGELSRALPMSVFLAKCALADLDFAIAEHRVEAATRSRSFLARAPEGALYRSALRLHLENVVGVPLGAL